MMYFLQRDDFDIQANTLKAVGCICIRHYEFMLEKELKTFYHKLLTSDEAPLKMKAEVLINIENYLVEEENRMIQQDLECEYGIRTSLIFLRGLNYRVQALQRREFKRNG